MVTVVVSRRAARRVADGHPWVFSGDVTDRAGATPGDVVRVADTEGRLLGTAHYSSTSRICLRLLDDGRAPIDADFYRRRLAEAAAYRRRVVTDTDAYRLVHGEGDRLAGLVVDRYGEYLVVQTLSQGMDKARDTILACLIELCAPAGVVARNDVGVRRHESLPMEKAVLAGSVPETVPIRMNGLRFHVDLLGGQKTGVFLDQRENYRVAAGYARGKALDCFTSSGGFALHLASRCDSVEAIDTSQDALRLAGVNCRDNGIENVHCRQADAFEFLGGLAASGRRFATIVLDPPAFAKSRNALPAALDAYRELNFRALRLLEPAGVLTSCSCSQHVSEAQLLESIAAAALEAGRTLRVIERRTQARDHSILLTVPETHYLKCLILEVL